MNMKDSNEKTEDIIWSDYFTKKWGSGAWQSIVWKYMESLISDFFC